jgi:hypothetical protein
MNISKKDLNDLEIFSQEEFGEFVQVTEAMDRVAKMFLENLEANINAAKFSGSGSLLSTMDYRVSDDGKSVDIILNNYYDYVNQGVKGWGSSTNAPNSPYAYSKKAKSSSNGDFRRSITEYISSGKAKLRNVQNDRAFGIGIEGKRKSLIDARVDTMMYLIRRFGVKATNYFTKTVNESRDDIQLIIAEAVGKDFVLKFKVK